MAGHRRPSGKNAYRSHAREHEAELGGHLGMGSPQVSWNEPGSTGPVFRDDAIRQGLTTFNGEALPAAGAANRHIQPASGTGHRKVAAAQHMHFGGP